GADRERRVGRPPVRAARTARVRSRGPDRTGPRGRWPADRRPRHRGRLGGRRRISAEREGGFVIRVLIADDQAMVRTGFGMIIGAQADMEVVGEAADGVEAVALARKL